MWQLLMFSYIQLNKPLKFISKIVYFKKKKNLVDMKLNIINNNKDWNKIRKKERKKSKRDLER